MSHSFVHKPNSNNVNGQIVCHKCTVNNAAGNTFCYLCKSKLQHGPKSRSLMAWLTSNGLDDAQLIRVLVNDQELDNIDDLLLFSDNEIRSVLLNKVTMGKIAKLINALNRYRIKDKGNEKNQANQPLCSSVTSVEQKVSTYTEQDYDWNNAEQLNLKGGSGGGAAQKQYKVNGIVVEASHPVLHFYDNSSFYHMRYMFNGDVKTAHGSSNPANYVSNAFRTSFWLTVAPKEAKNQQLTFKFPESIKLSYINVFADIGSMTNCGRFAPNAMYSIDLFHNNGWTVFCGMIDTKNDALGIKRTHKIRQIVDGIRFNLKATGSYIGMKGIDFFVVK